MTLTSQYSWLYNQYPFSNDPNAGLLHPDWWITECGCVPAATTPDARRSPRRSGPMHFYDEQRLLLGRTLPGRRQGPADRARRQQRRVDGHRPARLRARRRRRTSSSSRRTCCCSAPTRPAGATRPTRSTRRSRSPSRRTCKVYVPPGTYQVNRHIIVDDVTIEGAGSWYTIIKGTRGRARRRRPRTARCTPASASTARTRRTAAAATCTCPASPSRATCASASTPTRSTASAAR